MSFATLGVDLVAKIASFEENMNKARGSVDSLDKRFGVMSASFKSFGAGLAAALSVGALGAFARSGIDAADGISKLSDRVGVSVRDLASLKLAADQSDTSLEGLGKGIARLSRSIGEAEDGNSKLADALSQLGITARDPKEAFFQIADAVKRIQDPVRRAALLSQVLGKSYQDLLPLLSQGGDALRKSAAESETFADAMSRLAPEAVKFNDQLTALKQNAAQAAAIGLSPLVKSINDYIASIKDVVENGSALEKVGFFSLGFISEESLNRTREASERVQDYNLQIAKLQSELVHLQKTAGPEASIVKKYEADIARISATREILIKQSKKDAADAAAASAKSDGGDLVNYSNALQESLRKAFSGNPLDDFLAKFKDRRKAISDEYRALKAELDGVGEGETSSLDITSQITIGRSALAAGNVEAAQAAAALAKSQLKQLAAQDGTAGFEESYFLRELERLETDVLNSTEQTATKVQQVLQDKLSVLTKDATQLTVEVDAAAIVEQVKRAIVQIKKDLADDPLRVPIVAVPTISPDGRQAVDLSREALKYGRRR